MTKNVVLPDTSLCVIVRDEITNPAGGIERFVDSHVPFVEQAVIVDTGSIDGTREKLEELQGKYPNLKVFDIPFEGYADARNKSLSFVKTKRALILDADELLTHKTPQNDWAIIKEIMEMHKKRIYAFDFLAISPDEQPYVQFDAHFKRLFDVEGMAFQREVGEALKHLLPGYPIDTVRIKHFVPSIEVREKKENNWYLISNKRISNDEEFLIKQKRLNLWKNSPTSIWGFDEWKAYNPKRDDYI
jgi:glycosyltransferase involved in cell wall biosynthesis